MTKVQLFGLTEEEVLLEYMRMHALLAFPSDSIASGQVYRLLVENWELAGKPIDLNFGSVILDVLFTNARKRISQGISAGLVANSAIDLHEAGMKVSLNRASFLASETALSVGKISIGIYGEPFDASLKSGVKRIAQNFRSYKNVCHFWAAVIKLAESDLESKWRESLGETDPDQLGLGMMSRYLQEAGSLRINLLNIEGFGASEFGMFERMFAHTNQSYSYGKRNPDKLMAIMQNYRNPNMGP